MSATLPTVTLVTSVCAVIAIVLFMAGYIKGFTASVADHAAAPSEARDDTSRRFVWPICAAVVASGLVIALLGVSPVFILLAPFLSIISAGIIGLLFFIEPHLD
jgi:hypothetical protein